MGTGGTKLSGLHSRPCVGFCRTGMVVRCEEGGKGLGDLSRLSLCRRFARGSLRHLSRCLTFSWLLKWPTTSTVFAKVSMLSVQP